MSLIASSYPEQPDSENHAPVATTITGNNRWQAYHRLQELEIDCSCGGFQPLQVQVSTPTEAVQLWAVIRRLSLPRETLAASLRQCWRLSTSQ